MIHQVELHLFHPKKFKSFKQEFHHERAKFGYRSHIDHNPVNGLNEVLLLLLHGKGINHKHGEVVYHSERIYRGI